MTKVAAISISIFHFCRISVGDMANWKRFLANVLRAQDWTEFSRTKETLLQNKVAANFILGISVLFMGCFIIPKTKTFLSGEVESPTKQKRGT